MSLGIFQIGQKPTFTFTFKDVNGSLTNPTSPRLQIKDPEGTETDYTTGFSSASTGIYTWTFPAVLTLSGRYTVRALDDGSVGFAAEEVFEVADSDFAALPS